MIITKMALPRRTFLRGMGSTIALPLLDAMVPALSAQTRTAANPVRRFGAVYIPNGTIISEWTPRGEGRITELSPILKPLAPFLNQVTVVSNLENKPADSPVNGNHPTASAAFLTAASAKHTEGSDYRLATSIDQIAAQHIGRDTLLPSLELGAELLAYTGVCDSGYACVYVNSLSWSSPTTPLPTEADPRTVFERLFGDGGTPEDRRADLRAKGSILDWVRGSMAGLQGKLGAGDRSKVSQYLDSIREVERRIQKAEEQNAGLPEAHRPVAVPAFWEDHVKLMFDLLVLAFQADITRVSTFQIGRESSGRTYPQLGVTSGHHAVSHHQGNPERIADIVTIGTYHASLFAYLLEKLRSTPDGDGSLLDHSLFLYGGGLGEPNLHLHTQLPIVVAGGGAGRGGRHINYAEPTPMANLLLTLLDKVGVPLDRISDSTGGIDEMLEPLPL